MLAKIEKQSNGYIVTYNRQLEQPQKVVWEMLTNNDKLSLWFNELRIIEHNQGGGYLNFDMGDGTYEKMDITDYQEYNVLEFTWGDDLVRFELIDQGNRCNLLLIEKVTKLTEHTPKDLAGWHVCLDVIAMILDKKEVENRMDSWKYWFEKYNEALSLFK
ncbi:SRPBCC family protein [Paucisalibacillus globulus]|uniref:SRPBCC family protein n=1 Tax=Paucisalibacillus globulus TaxID=351095 RepID=UPI000423ED32|nr:SRPBCC family protein [Paucisalibacillus globulus]